MNDYTYKDIEIGKVFEFRRCLNTSNADKFTELTGDKNPLHNDNEYAKNTQFGGRVAHGMLAASLFSTLFGVVCPGKRNLYLSQTLNFRKPVMLGSDLVVRGKVKNKIDSLKLLVVDTEILFNEEVMIDGEAKVKVMDDE